MAVSYYIGTSGWHYEHWRGEFYPEKLPRAKWFEYYTDRFGTVELNNSFYRLPSENTFRSWYESSPEGFVFALKASRFITHIKRLADCREAVDNFTERAKILGGKLGPILYQLPPGLRRDDERLKSFVSGLPHGVRHVLEFRHGSWLSEDVFDILRGYNIGLCVFDMPSLRCPLTATADFAYIRFHGSGELYSGSYSGEELAGWVERLSGLGDGVKTVYVYFNNDAGGFALKNAATMQGYLRKNEC